MSILLTVWTFLKSPLGRYVAIGAICVLLLLGLRHHWVGVGVQREVAAEARRLELAQAKVAKREVKASAISEHVAADLSKERVRIEYRTQVLTKEVPVYVTQAADTRCVVPVGFVQLYDAAASGSPTGAPPTPGGSVEAPSGVPLSAVLETDVANLGTGHDFRAEALAWRDWYAKQAAEWGK